MRCGVHTLQLAILDGLKMKYSQIILTKIRQVVVKLRTSTIRNILLKLYGVRQSVDTVTHWGLTFVMIDRLLIFQDHCKQVAAAGSKEIKIFFTIII